MVWLLSKTIADAPSDPKNWERRYSAKASAESGKRPDIQAPQLLANMLWNATWQAAGSARCTFAIILSVNEWSR